MSETINKIPAEILESLKHHQAHRDDVTCLECGYKGMMGISDDGLRIFLSTFLAFALTLLVGITGLYGFIISPAIFGGSWVVFANITAQQKLECPSCKQTIVLKR